MLHKKIIHLQLASILLICFISIDCQSKQPDGVRTKNISVIVNNDSTGIKFNAGKENASNELFYESKIIRIESSPKHNFLALHLKSQYLAKRFVVVDLENHKQYSGYRNNILEKTWSTNANYGFFKTDTSFLVVHSIELSNFFDNSIDSNKIVEVKGHPLGNMIQYFWENEKFLLFSSGVDEMECWGVLDISQKVNYLIGCCGIDLLRIDSCNTEKPWSDRYEEFISKRAGIKCGLDFYRCIYDNLK